MPLGVEESEKQRKEREAKQKVDSLILKATKEYANRQGITADKVVEAYYCRTGQYGNELELLCYAPVEEPTVPTTDLGFQLHNEDEHRHPKAPKPTIFKAPVMSTEIVVKGSMGRLVQHMELAKEPKERSCCIRRAQLTQTWSRRDDEAMIVSLRGDNLHGKG